MKNKAPLHHLDLRYIPRDEGWTLFHRASKRRVRNWAYDLTGFYKPITTEREAIKAASLFVNQRATLRNPYSIHVYDKVTQQHKAELTFPRARDPRSSRG